jgi:FKBP-type peptidyl-prolyl cis-trans isomerase
MKQFFLVVGISLITVVVDAQKKKGTAAPKAKTTTVAKALELKTSLDSFSYALGMNIGTNLKSQNITDINSAIMLKAMEETFAGKTTALTEQQAGMSIQNTLQAKVAKKAQAQKEEGIAFLQKNKQRSGVIVLPNGLQYEVLKSGDPNSAMPQLQDTVVAHYAGTLIDGKEFDNSYKRNEPITIPVGGVIRGWTEILQKMHIGDKWKVYIPSDLGYGDGGMGQDIPGGSVLIFEMELVGVKPAGVQPVEEVAPMPAPSSEQKKN